MVEETEPEFDNWKDAWEWNARQTQIWTVFQKKGTLKSALPILEYIKRHSEDEFDLDHFHAAEVLFAILGMPDPNEKW